MTAPSNRQTIRLDVPDANFKLTPQQRANVRQDFDVNALERLLAAVDAPVRPLLLRSFLVLEPGETPTVTVKMGDPALQSLLDEVWAPVWEKNPEMLDRETKDFPGREIARARRAQRARP